MLTSSESRSEAVAPALDAELPQPLEPTMALLLQEIHEVNRALSQFRWVSHRPPHKIHAVGCTLCTAGASLEHAKRRLPAATCG